MATDKRDVMGVLSYCARKASTESVYRYKRTVRDYPSSNTKYDEGWTRPDEVNSSNRDVVGAVSYPFRLD